MSAPRATVRTIVKSNRTPQILAALKRAGKSYVTFIQNVIKSNVGPELSGTWDPATGYLGWRRKHYPDAGQRTLIASGLLLRSVQFRLHLDGIAAVEAKQAEAMRQDQAPAGAHQAKRAAQPGRDPFGRFVRKATSLLAEARGAARKQGEAMKAQHRAQRAAANRDPKAHAAAFAAQRHGFKGRFDKK